MSLNIIRVTGDIVYEPVWQRNLVRFLSQNQSVNLLVASAVPEISTLVAHAIDQVFYSGADSGNIAEKLHSIWEKWNLTGPTDRFIQEVEKLSNLLRGIYLTGDYSPALRDAVQSQGEVLSALLIGGRLADEGLRTGVIHPAEMGLIASADFGNATFIEVDVEKLQDLSADTVWIIPGSFGLTLAGKIARAGKAAADYTAAFLVAETSTSRLVLWGAGKSFYSADHKTVPEAGVINRLTYAEASELAYFDHFSLHPRTVEPLIRKHIPIHILDAAESEYEPVTIINTENFVTPRVVKSVASTDDISILKLNGPGVGLKPGILARITGKLAEASVNIKSVITSQVSINILLDSKCGRKAQSVAGELGFTAVSEIELLEDVSLIAIVGHGMQSNYGISATLFGAVAQNKINVILSGSGASDLVSYLLVHSSDRDKSVRAIYTAFFKNEIITKTIQ